MNVNIQLCCVLILTMDSFWQIHLYSYTSILHRKYSFSLKKQGLVSR